MVSLTLIGYWASDSQPELPDPTDAVDTTWDTRERELVIDYLKGGLPILFMMGHSPCRMCDLEANGAAELTDGVYLWPEGLAHYLEHHAVRLPDEFVTHATRRLLELDDAAAQAHRRPLDEWLRMTR